MTAINVSVLLRTMKMDSPLFTADKRLYELAGHCQEPLSNGLLQGNYDDFYSTVYCTLFSIFFILIIFFFIIFNEVLILNFCGLDYNTNKRIKSGAESTLF